MDALTRRAMFGFGAFGGIMPTLAQLATTYVANPESPLPAIGMYYGLGLFGAVGGGVALTNSSRELRQAIFAGIAAPAILMSMISGATGANMQRKKMTDLLRNTSVLVSILGAAAAHAEDANKSQGGAGEPSSNVGSLGPATLVISSKVHGGAPVYGDIPITAQVSVNGKSENVAIGTLSSFSGSAAFGVPAGATAINIGDQAIPVTGAITQARVNVATKPTAIGDFLWALGATRQFNIRDIKVEPASGQPSSTK